jgi:hypothetical protein
MSVLRRAPFLLEASLRSVAPERSTLPRFYASRRRSHEPHKAYSTAPVTTTVLCSRALYEYLPLAKRSSSPPSFRLRPRQQARLLHAISRSSIVDRNTFGNTAGTPQLLQNSLNSFSTSSRIPSPAASSSSKPVGPKALYADKVRQGLLKEDPRQVVILEDLQEVYDGIVNYHPPPVPEPLEDISGQQEQQATSFFGRLFGSASSSSSPPIPVIPEDVPKSLYLFGDVGCGKSMLMDLVGSIILCSSLLFTLQFAD